MEEEAKPGGALPILRIGIVRVDIARKVRGEEVSSLPLKCEWSRTKVYNLHALLVGDKIVDGSPTVR